MEYITGKYFIFILFYVMCSWKLCLSNETFDIILLGSSGDLARKYLWKSLHELHTDGYKLAIWAGSRSKDVNLHDLLTKSIGTVRQNQFDDRVQSVVLMSEDDYRNLCTTHLSPTSTAHLFYLAIPPYAYNNTVYMIMQQCRDAVLTGRVRVILEKPFGHDYDSAKELSESLSSLLYEDYIYRIDHFLGKSVLRALLNFRRANPHIESRLNNRSVRRVDVVLQESLDVKGRSSYYDHYGVIRDVMQNHLTEMFLLALVDLPEDVHRESGKEIKSDALSEAKVSLLRNLRSVASPLVGQYAGYGEEELGRSTRTATFAAILLQAFNRRWQGVPLLITSGKKLAAKASYIRIVFDDSQVCFPHNISHTCGHAKSEELLVFLDGDAQPRAGFLCSPTLACRPPPGFEPLTSGILGNSWFTSGKADAIVMSRSDERSAYTNLLKDALGERRESFVGEDHLLESWRLWSGIVGEAEELALRVYSRPEDVELQVTPNGLGWKREFPTENQAAPVVKVPVLWGRHSILIGPWSTLNRRYIAPRVSEICETAIRTRGQCHMALPGGRSADWLLDTLAGPDVLLDWTRVHIWLTDERCVPPTSKNSNMRHLDEKLLSRFGMLRGNVHGVPLPGSEQRAAAECEFGAQFYRSDYESTFTDTSPGLDVAVLGVGGDGHVASLFPSNQEPMERGASAVVVVSLVHAPHWPRVTLTMEALDRTQNLLILITGSEKANIARTLLTSKEPNANWNLPVVRLLERRAGEQSADIFVDSHIEGMKLDTVSGA